MPPRALSPPPPMNLAARHAMDGAVARARAWSRDRLLRSSAGLVVLTTSANALAVLLHVLLGRMLGPAAFGTLLALLALLALVERPLGALQLSVAHHVARQRQDPGPLGGALRALLRGAVVGGAAAGAAVALAAPVLEPTLEAPLPLLGIVAAGAAITAPASVLLGMAQGRHRFLALGSAALAGSVTRVALALALVAAGWGVAGGLLGSLGRTLVALLAGLAIVGLPPGPPARGGAGVVAAYAVPVGVGMLGVEALTALDVLAAKAFLAAEDAGAYAGASALAKVALLLPAAVGTVLLPLASGPSLPPARVLRRALGATLGLCVPLAVAFALAPALLVEGVLGARFAPAAAVLPVLGFGMAATAVVALLLRYFLATRRVRAAIALASAGALEAALLAVHHASPLAIAWVVLASSSLAAAAGAWWAFRGLRRAPAEAAGAN